MKYLLDKQKNKRYIITVNKKFRLLTDDCRVLQCDRDEIEVDRLDSIYREKMLSFFYLIGVSYSSVHLKAEKISIK